MSTDTSRPVRALVVDDNPDIREFVSSVLASTRCEVHVATDGEQGLSEALEFQPDVVFLDIKLPKQFGWLVCAKLKLLEPSPRVILITGLDFDDLDSFSKFVKASGVLRKPFSADDVLRFIPSVLAKAIGRP